MVASMVSHCVKIGTIWWRVTELNMRSYLHKWIIFFLFLSLSLSRFISECDQTFVSRIGGPQNGSFTAPVMNNLSNHSKQCLYIFLAGPGQRVEITFTTFNLRGSPPEYVLFSLSLYYELKQCAVRKKKMK